MKKFLLGFATGLVIAGLVAFLLVLGFLAAFTLAEPTATITDNSVLVLNLSGAVPEQSPVDIPIPLLGETPPLTVIETWQTLRKAATDDRIRALVLEPQGLDIGWAKMEELRAEVVQFKESGKPVYAFLRSPSAREYYIATAADQIFMAPDEWLDVKGLRAELMYLKNTLDKVGVALEFEGIGLYKDAPDQFQETSPSPQTLEVTNLMLDQFFGKLIGVIAEGRKREPEAIRALIDQGPFVGQNAVDGGLIDAMIFEDQMFERLEDQLNLDEEATRIAASDYSKMAVSGFGEGAKIAIVTGDGEILPSGSGEDLSAAAMTAAGMKKALRQVGDDASIRGVIVRVDSPGGDAIASAEILHEVKTLSEKKPVIISMSDYAASGGYMMAMSGDPILAYDNTLTGSIGVFFGKLTLRGLYDKVGVNKYLLTRGRWAAIDSDYTPLTPDARARLRVELERYYRGFVGMVAEGRNRPYDEVEPLAQGRVWTGEQARQNGLIDEIGGLDRALELIKAEADIPAGDSVNVVAYPARRTFLEVILNREQPATVGSPGTELEFAL